MPLFNQIFRFARSRQGRMLISRASRYAQTPEGRRRITEARRRLTAGRRR